MLTSSATSLPRRLLLSRGPASSPAIAAAGTRSRSSTSTAAAKAFNHSISSPSLRRPLACRSSPAPSTTTITTRRLVTTIPAMTTLDAIRQNCRKVVCIGRNYADHITELSSARPSQPFFFLKPPTSILLPESGPCLRPTGTDLHYEIELGLVLNRSLRDLDPDCPAEEWQSAIGHYVLAIDMTARNVQNEAKKKGLPWDIAKGFDTFCPLAGPIDKAAVPDPHDAEIWLSVNGEARQQDSTGLMLFRIPRMLADISRVMTLEAGDIVLTGTPKGVGSVKPGDVMTAGLKVNGKEVVDGGMRVEVAEKGGRYEFKET